MLKEPTACDARNAADGQQALMLNVVISFIDNRNSMQSMHFYSESVSDEGALLVSKGSA